MLVLGSLGEARTIVEPVDPDKRRSHHRNPTPGGIVTPTYQN
jgi:hypothetical protein